MDGFLSAILGWAAGGFLNGIAGFGGALVALPIVAMGSSMRVAVGSTVLIVLALSTQQAYCYRKATTLPGLRYLLIGAVLGMAGGVFLLRTGSEAMLRIGLGAFLVLYGFCGPWLAGKNRRDLNRRWAGAAGFFATALGTAFGINGPPLAIYFSLIGESQAEVKGNLGVCFFLTGILIIIGQGLSGTYTPHTFALSAAAVPATLLGAGLGIRLSSRLNDRAFGLCLYAVLLCLGANMIRQGLAL